MSIAKDLEQIITYMEVTHPDNILIINKLKGIYEEINTNVTQQTDRREVVHAFRWKSTIFHPEVQASYVRE